jgi:hypothetical protein
LLLTFPSAGVTILPGSAAHVPPLLGFVNVPAAVAVTGTVMVTLPPAGIVSWLLPLPPTHVSVLLAMLHVHVPPTPDPSPHVGLP